MLTTAKCTCCGTIQATDSMIKTAMAKRGGANAYMCTHCATHNQSYHSTGAKNRGTQKVNGVYVGIELETSYTDDYARNMLFEYGLIPTHDGSLQSEGAGSKYGWADGNACEYVTGILSGLNIASKMCVTIETLKNQGFLKINESCGTHFHVSIDSMKNECGEKVYMGYITRFYQSLFTPLCEAMQAHPHATEALFGRNFSRWAKSVNAYTVAGDRYNFINVTNNSNVEFRLNKFVSAQQYQNLMKMEVEMVQAIVTNFCQHFNDEPKDKRRYPTKTAYRKHKAQTTAKKLVTIFKKYANI